MKDKDIKCNFTKVCGIAYEFVDIERVVNFCDKHCYKYYYIKHLADEEVNKAHYHFIIESDSYHRFNIKTLLTDTFKINLFEKCNNVASYLRYMTHIDYDNKHHYDIKDIISCVSIDVISTLIYESSIDKEELEYNAFVEICCLINSKDLRSLFDVIEYCKLNSIKYKTSWTFTFWHLLNSIKD